MGAARAADLCLLSGRQCAADGPPSAARRRRLPLSGLCFELSCGGAALRARHAAHCARVGGAAVHRARRRSARHHAVFLCRAAAWTVVLVGTLALGERMTANRMAAALLIAAGILVHGLARRSRPASPSRP